MATKQENMIFVLLLFGLGIWGAYSIYQPFLLSMVVGALLAMATSNLTNEISNTLHSRLAATSIMTILLTFLILAPILYIATTGVEYLSHLDKETIQAIFTKARALTEHIPTVNRIADEYLRADKVTPYLKEISIFLTKIGGKGLGFIKDLGMVIVFYSAVGYYQDRFFILAESLIPAPRKESRDMISEMTSTMEIVFYSIIFTAIFEGFLFGIFIGHFGLNGLLLGAIYGFASLIPVVGGTMVWLPVSLFVWGKLGPEDAILVALYSIVMISIIADTFIKPIIIKIIKDRIAQKDSAGINELVIFFSIIAGMSTYGFWGMILGPAITTFLFVATRIYINYRDAIEG